MFQELKSLDRLNATLLRMQNQGRERIQAFEIRECTSTERGRSYDAILPTEEEMPKWRETRQLYYD